jgi:protein MPE1
MASSVFFRFKSSKEPSRVTFDGTGISVFELKREIITGQRLGDGTDFELILSSDDSEEGMLQSKLTYEMKQLILDPVYDDDTTIIPRSTTVIAKRLPAAKPGRGGAARYVSGKMPVNAKNSHRSENASKANSKSSSAKPSTTYTNVSELQTEEERMAAVLKMGADQWEQQQQEMAKSVPPVSLPRFYILLFAHYKSP